MFLFSLLLVTSRTFGADSLVTWKAQIRVRGEMDGRDFDHASSPNLYSLLRTRLGADLHPAKDLLISILLQDSRVLGQFSSSGPSNTSANLKNTDLHQGYLRLERFFTEGLSLSLGRMKMGFDSERLVGYLDWSNVGRVFDGALLRCKINNHVLDLFVHDVVELSVPASPVSRSTVTSVGSEGFLFWGGHYSYKGIEGQTFSAYGYQDLNHQGNSTTEMDRNRWTSGVFANGSAGDFFYEAEGALQVGTLEESDIEAFLVAGNAGLSLGDFSLHSIMGGYEYLSGTPAGSEKVKSFDPPFSTAHKFLGIMDYFTSIPLQTFNRGLEDVHARMVIRPADGLSVAVTGHNFRLAEYYVGRKNLGQEIDVVGTLRYGKHVMFEVGGGSFFPDEIMKFEYGGEDPAFWGYAMVTAGF